MLWNWGQHRGLRLSPMTLAAVDDSPKWQTTQVVLLRELERARIGVNTLDLISRRRFLNCFSSLQNILLSLKAFITVRGPTNGLGGMAVATCDGMRDIQHVFEALFARWPDGFRNKHLAQALGVSRARASQLLASRVLSGELATVDEGRRKYVRGRDSGASGGVARGSLAHSLWRSIARDCACLAYVAFSSLGLSQLRTRQQVRAALRGIEYPRRYLVADFEGVHSVSRAACAELFITVSERSGILVQPIHLEPMLARKVLSVVRPCE